MPNSDKQIVLSSTSTRRAGQSHNAQIAEDFANRGHPMSSASAATNRTTRTGPWMASENVSCQARESV